MLASLVDFISDFYRNVILFFNWLVEFFSDLLGDIGHLFLRVLKDFSGWVFEAVEPVFADIAESVPDLNAMMASSRPVFRQAMYVCDRMFAIGEGITILLLFLAFVWVFILVKLALKLFPCIG